MSSYKGGTAMTQPIRFTALSLLLAIASVLMAPSAEPPAAQKYIFDDLKPVPPQMAALMKEMQRKSQSTVEGTRIVDLDTTRADGAPYMDFVWLWKGSSKGYVEEEHIHDFDEAIGFV